MWLFLLRSKSLSVEPRIFQTMHQYVEAKEDKDKERWATTLFLQKSTSEVVQRRFMAFCWLEKMQMLHNSSWLLIRNNKKIFSLPISPLFIYFLLSSTFDFQSPRRWASNAMFWLWLWRSRALTEVLDLIPIWISTDLVDETSTRFCGMKPNEWNIKVSTTW